MHWGEGHVLAEIVFLCLCLVTNLESQNQIYSYYSYSLSTANQHQLHQIDAMTDPDHDITAALLPPAPPLDANDTQRPNAWG